MLMLNVIWTFIILYEVKSDRISDAVWSNMDGIVINNITEYCENKICVIKCCPDGHVIVRKNRQFSCFNKGKNITEFYNYTDWYDPSSKMNKNPETSQFKFIQNEIFSHFVNMNVLRINKPSDARRSILQNGSFRTPDRIRKRLEYCVDFNYAKKNNTYYIAYGYLGDDRDPDEKAINLYIGVGMLISAFFMLLVLFVYAVLPSLQNIVGMVLMGYLVSMTMSYIIRGAQILKYYSPEDCRSITPAVYYFFLASFFWLNIMAFDLWWTLRGLRKCRDIHRQGERIKYLRYSLVAWGMPALMTLILVILDSTDSIAHLSYFKPRFDQCLRNIPPTIIFFYVPIGLLTTVNCILFALTVYNIWLIRRGIATSQDSCNTKNNENRSKIYAKLFILMGVTWILELIPTTGLAANIIVNFVNIFVGVTIFYIFVCKKSTIIMLCKRFNIRNSYVDRANNSRTQTTSSGRAKSSISNKNRDEESGLTTSKDYDATKEEVIIQ